LGLPERLRSLEPPAGLVGSPGLRRITLVKVRPNLRMQSTGRGGPGLCAGATLLVVIQSKRRFVRARAR
jgi:hypothetical protein